MSFDCHTSSRKTSISFTQDLLVWTPLAHTGVSLNSYPRNSFIICKCLDVRSYEWPNSSKLEEQHFLWNVSLALRCVCLSGYEEVGGRCQDIDECLDRMVCGTDSECQVFMVMDSNKTCIDISEVTFLLFVQNSPGSYRCVCKQGFRNSGHSCIGWTSTFPLVNIFLVIYIFLSQILTNVQRFQTCARSR